MSWIYTIVFAGLMFSSNGGALNSPPALALSQSAQADKQVKQDESERTDQTYPFNPNGRVSVSNVNGSITVESWERNEIRLESIKTADSKETLSEVQIRVEARQDSFNVETDYGSWQRQPGGTWKNRKIDVQFHLWVPRGAVLDEIETVNGSVTVSNFINITKISAVNGNVNASNLRGTANLSTVNGEVLADFDRLETGSRISLETVNGRVNLTIPSDASATVRADSVNGSITNDFGLPVRKGQYVGRDLYGRIGSGDVQVKLSSVNGPLSIGRKSDGRSLSPATNLLPQKSKDDEDMDDNDSNDESSNVDVQKMNRDVARQVRQSQRDVMVMKEKQKELMKVKPMKVEVPPIEIPKIDIDLEAINKATAAIDAEKLNESVKKAVDMQKIMPRMFEVNRMRMPRVEKRSDSFVVKGVPKVTVDAPGCAVRVRAWDKQEVQYTVSQYTDARDRAAFTSSENHTDSAVNIKVVNNDQESRDGVFSNEMRRVRVDVFVPKKSNLRIVTNGEIRVEGVSGDLELKGADESINVRDVDGKMALTNGDGLVRIVGFHGELNATTSDGDVYLEGDFDKLTGNASDGSFYLTVPETANASISSNTEIDSGNVNVKEAGENKWQLGNGGKNYTFHFGGGSLNLRCANDIATL
jgi:DUF4097 and DUF4098 domain-containing protein YvlB